MPHSVKKFYSGQILRGVRGQLLLLVLKHPVHSERTSDKPARYMALPAGASTPVTYDASYLEDGSWEIVPAGQMKSLRAKFNSVLMYRYAANQVSPEASMPQFVFHKNQYVKHLKSQKVYLIVATPDEARLEASNEPAYGYRPVGGGAAWYRSQAEMEDGRFAVFTPIGG